ncbi:MAG: hypothetical protein HYY18_09685 [Planctomycetes bacterium]|nr:hypothetical protein [Planctomycetota bacterium]
MSGRATALLALAAAAAAFAGGLAAGSARRPLAPAAGEAAAPAASAARPAAVDPTAPRTPDAAAGTATASAADLLRALPALVERRDVAGLADLFRKLAALGEAGYPAAMQLYAAVFPDGEASLEEALERAPFQEALRPWLFRDPALLAWALEHSEAAPAGFRFEAAERFPRCAGADAGAMFLRLILTERDDSVAERMRSWLPFLADESMADRLVEIARTAPVDDIWDDHTDSLVQTIASFSTPAGERAFDLLLRDENPRVREAAAFERIRRHPPATGALVCYSAGPDEFFSAGRGEEQPLRRGDILLSMEGREIASNDDLAALLESLPGDRLVGVVVHRDGSSFTLQVPREKLPDLGLVPVRKEP